MPSFRDPGGGAGARERDRARRHGRADECLGRQRDASVDALHQSRRIPQREDRRADRARGVLSDLRLYDETKSVGFGAHAGTGAGPGAHRPESRRVTEKELLDYGLLAKFLGRLPVRVELDPLSEDDLYMVMTAPPDSVIREYQALLKMDGIDLVFSDEALRGIARFCIRRKTGARSLRTFIEEICHDIMFEAPERKGETITVEASFALERLERLADGASRNDRDGARP